MASGGEFVNKVVIVTGASSGLGQAAAILLATKGASIVLCGRDEDRLKSCLDQCVDTSGGKVDRFTYVIGDVTKPEVRKAIVDKAIDTFQRLDILVANAGTLFHENGIENTTEEAYDAAFDTNVKSMFFLIQAALSQLEKTGGNIICVSSFLSTNTCSRFPVFPMTKAAVDHMTRCLALDLAPKGIRVNAVNPSYFPSRLARTFGGDLDTAVQQIVEIENPEHPLHGKCVEVESVAESIAFLASDAAKFITGQCHIVDGGRHYRGALGLKSPSI